MFLVCRRQLRDVERQLHQYAQQGAVLGALIKNHDAMWGGFVEDAATILTHQYHGLAALRRAGDGVVYGLSGQETAETSLINDAIDT
jgi:hypothetical protein